MRKTLSAAGNDKTLIRPYLSDSSRLVESLAARDDVEDLAQAVCLHFFSNRARTWSAIKSHPKV